MFVTVKGKSILIGAVTLVVVVALCVTMTVAASPSAQVPKIGKTVVIDAGHGGMDGGVVGRSGGVKEADINLAIAKKLETLLIENGYDAVMTRGTTDDLAKSGEKNKKLSDMKARRDIIDAAKPDLVVSIHQNAYPLKKVNGPQVFYYAGSERAEAYAKTMQGVLNAHLQNDRVHKSGDYYILNCTEYPSILIECGFLSNPEEERLLASAPYQEKVAYTVYSGIQALFGIGDSAQTVYPLS
ncbi:MAG: N-acetylmuramoyl-L-alanine amidase [Clostridiales bacterium]|jgi:N-acetylmuramoyl-L-alanine amidase|nr:N-acetylmuramoyl-L-alanine amidase [Clostridiales bacterium]